MTMKKRTDATLKYVSTFIHNNGANTLTSLKCRFSNSVSQTLVYIGNNIKNKCLNNVSKTKP